MIEVVIKFDSVKQNYLVYEPTTETMLVTTNLTEALLELNKFLMTSGLIKTDILGSQDISYHIDSETMKSIIEGNLSLIKRLRNAPSGFMISSQRFGQGSGNQSENSKARTRSTKGGFASAKGFKESYKKFGSKYL